MNSNDILTIQISNDVPVNQESNQPVTDYMTISIDDEIEDVNQKSFKDKKLKNINHLEGFVEIQQKYIRHLHGSWLKYSDQRSVFSGGFLDKIEENKVFLRCPAKENIVVDINDHIFYVKQTNENFIALLELVKDYEHQNFTVDTKVNELREFKTKILKLIGENKIKITK